MNLLALLKRPKRPNEDGDLPDLAGKVVVIYPNVDTIGGGLFQDAKLVRIGFNEFVVGRRVGLEPPWQERWSRATVWTSIHQIAQMVIFDDVDSAKVAFEHDQTGVSSEPV
jgi:hypothetical protein